MNIYQKYRNISLTTFLECLDMDSEGWIWSLKRLSGNDTNLTGAHQSGIYLPEWFFASVFPEICTKVEFNPKKKATCYFPAQDYFARTVTATYYNSKYHPERNNAKQYDEFRLTGWGGRNCPLQHPDNTGVIAIVACRRRDETVEGLAWVCSGIEEEAIAESWLGCETFPAEIYGRSIESKRALPKSLQDLVNRCIQPEWKKCFPSGDAIFSEILRILPGTAMPEDPDRLLIERRKLEFATFQTLEQLHVYPAIEKGFKGVDDFLRLALSVANRRKSRTGRSLELNLENLFRTAQLQFERGATTEMRKRPDFLFPSEKAYKTPTFPANHLHMLAAKTCCKDRWRQVMSEADRIQQKHLFTLQEGISETQWAEMRNAQVVLVVPKANLERFPKSFRNELLDLRGFIGTVRDAQCGLALR